MADDRPLPGCSVQMTKSVWETCAKHRQMTVPKLMEELQGRSTDEVVQALQQQGLNVQFDQVVIEGENNKFASGKVITNIRDCFPGSAEVQARSGPKSMDNLEIGEEVLVFNSNKMRAEFSKVTTFLHSDPHGGSDYLEICTEDGQKVLCTGMHKVFQGTNDVYPIELNEGDHVTVCHKGQMKMSMVEAVGRVVATGRYCPLTQAGTIIVNDTAFSCFTQVSHAVGNVLFCPLRWRATRRPQGIHPYANMLMHVGMSCAILMPEIVRAACLGGALCQVVDDYWQGKFVHLPKRPRRFHVMVALVLVSLIILFVGLFGRAAQNLVQAAGCF
mmetsp:Transcript_68362/g.160855  ORF Transcript_68362/g.160855 Transcript_68362/m.160855 type:complete len:330 (+) Transcript_68362:197-1186(+)